MTETDNTVDEIPAFLKAENRPVALVPVSEPLPGTATPISDIERAAQFTAPAGPVLNPGLTSANPQPTVIGDSFDAIFSALNEAREIANKHHPIAGRSLFETEDERHTMLYDIIGAISALTSEVRVIKLNFTGK
jgi:hypothetical protein